MADLGLTANPDKTILNSVEADLDALEQSGDCWNWQTGRLDIWPVLKTAILSRSGEQQIYRTIGARLRFNAWRMSLSVPRLASAVRVKAAVALPPLSENTTLLVGGAGACRKIGDKHLAQQTFAIWAGTLTGGMSCTQWIEDVHAFHPAVALNWCAETRSLQASLASIRSRVARSKLRPLPETSMPAVEICARYCNLTTSQAARWLCELVNASIVLRDQAVIRFGHGRPSRVVVTAGGYWSTSAIVAAARELSIPSMEVQHGVMSNLMGPDYLLHPSRPNTLADLFLSHAPVGKSERDGEMGRLVTIGPGTLALHRETGLPPDLASAIASERSIVEKTVAQRTSTANCLLSHQDFDNLDWLPPVLNDLPDHIAIWLRLRNTDASGSIPAEILEHPKVEWKVPTSVSLGGLLPHMQAHVTQFSAVALEASCYGVPTLALHGKARSVYGPQMNESIHFSKPQALVTDLVDLLDAWTEKNGGGSEASELPTVAESWSRIEQAVRRLSEFSH